jgi:uncharacterized protein YbaR (Trm112 family)/SAM-dependent methyltransferase
MLKETLEILRCPYCGGRLELVKSLHHREGDRAIEEGILGCHCCVFPVVAGIPVLHLQPAAVEARGHVEQGRPDLALRVMAGVGDPAQAEIFERTAASDRSTYRDLVEALGPGFEGGYFLYRFSDPTFIVADAVVRALGRAVLRGRARALDLCGGSGHLTRSLVGLSSPPPVLADLFFPKMWLAQRFTVPGCEAVCCDGNAPLPFARGVFGLAMCSDAFQYIWTKRQLVAEMTRVVDPDEGAVLISHTHNQLAWSPSHGQPLSPAGYRDLFETLEPRVFGEAGLFEDVVAGGPLDLSREDAMGAVDQDPALTIIAPAAEAATAVWRPHPIDPPGTAPGPGTARGRWRINPLYAASTGDGEVRLRLEFPGPDYEDEYGACRRYLPDEATIDGAALAALETGRLTPDLTALARRRVILELPERYY